MMDVSVSPVIFTPWANQRGVQDVSNQAGRPRSDDARSKKKNAGRVDG